MLKLLLLLRVVFDRIQHSVHVLQQHLHDSDSEQVHFLHFNASWCFPGGALALLTTVVLLSLERRILAPRKSPLYIPHLKRDLLLLLSWGVILLFALLIQKDDILFINKCSFLLLFIHFYRLGILNYFNNFILVLIYVGVLGYRVPVASAFNFCWLSLVAEQGELGVEAWTDEESWGAWLSFVLQQFRMRHRTLCSNRKASLELRFGSC